MMSGLNSLQLRRAARLWGIQPSYLGMDRRTIWASEKTLCAVLKALTGVDPQTNADLDNLIEQARGQWLESVVPEVLTAPVGEPWTCPVHLPWVAPSVDSWTVRYELTNEQGELEHAGEVETTTASGRVRDSLAGRFVRQCVPLPELEPGYYRLRISEMRSGRQGESLIVSTHRGSTATPPKRASIGERSWGLFTPLYALRTKDDAGLGDLSHLRELQDVAEEFHIQWLSLLPLLSKTGMIESDHISPYSPQSRLFWNEIFLDMKELIDHESVRHPDTLARLRGEDLEALFAPASDSHLADYQGVFQRKKRVLLVLAEQFFENTPPNQYQEFLKERPDLIEFAEYYSDSEAEMRYHLYAQFQMHRQLLKLREKSERTGYGALYLDLPVGVQKDGFDFRRYAGLFAETLEVGSPPDMLFHAGQRWGFPPYHPGELKKSGYRYFREMIRNHFRYAKALRIDHVMGLYRIYVIPEGMEPKDGCYIRLPHRDLFAITRLEADLHGATVIGEDLGTVPPQVRQIMREFHVLRMWVAQIELLEKGASVDLDPPTESVASINTHDMPPWHAFMEGMDIDLWQKLGFYDAKTHRAEKRTRQKVIQEFSRRQKNPQDLYLWMINELARGPARALVLNLEDLWREDHPQNVPGTWKEHPNWKRRHRWTVEEWRQLPEIRQIFESIAEERL